MSRLTAIDVTAQIRDLPALPAVVMELIASLGRADANVADIARTIARDPAIAAKTLRLANSPFYGMPRKIGSLAEAASVLGLRMLRCVATTAALAGSLPATGCGAIDLRAFWRHSIGTALCAQELALALGRDADGAFTIGLLHDIGRLLLASRFAEPYAEVQAHRRHHAALQHESELAVLGIEHAAVGALIAEHWRFAPEFAQAIRHHHAPADDTGDSALDVLHVADNMAHALDLSQQEDDLVPPLSLAAWSRLGLDEALCRGVMGRAEAQHRAIREALAI